MIRLRQPIEFAAAAAKMRHHAAPALPRRHGHQTQRIVTPRITFETVEEHNQPGFLPVIEPIKVDEIAVGCLPALTAVLKTVVFAKPSRIQGLQISARQPPRSTVIRRAVDRRVAVYVFLGNCYLFKHPGKIRNSKLEIRNNKNQVILITKIAKHRLLLEYIFEIFVFRSFELVSTFGFRACSLKVLLKLSVF